MYTVQIQKILKEGTILQQSNTDIVKIILHLSKNSYVPSELKDYRVSITYGGGNPLLGYTIKATNRDEALKIAEVTYEARMLELSVEMPDENLAIAIL
jgi:hypothetical protein